MRRLLPLLALLACAPARESITPPGATRLAAYSTAVRAGGLVFFSGVIGVKPGTRELAGPTTAEQTRQALENLRAALAAAGLTPAHLVKCTVFLVDMADYEAMNAIYAPFVAPDPPARSAVAVAGLPLNARIEIECIASRQ